MNAKQMKIHLNGLRIYAYHGVFEQENHVGAEYIINLSLTTDFSAAAEKDELKSTVNYAEIYQLIKQQMNIPSKLLEHVAYRISENIFNEFPSITEIELTINKQNPPMGAQCEEVGIDVIYSRQ